MLFDPTHPPLEAEFQAAHPELRAVLVGLDHWSDAQRIRRPEVTCIRRSAIQNARAYILHYSTLRMELITSGALRNPDPKLEVRNRRELAQLLSRAQSHGLMAAVLAGEVLSPEQRVHAGSLLSDEFVEKESRARFTWHSVLCAADLRAKHYTGDEKSRVMAWLSTKCREGAAWELTQDTVGGPCIHIARKDPTWAQQHKFEHGGGNV